MINFAFPFAFIGLLLPFIVHAFSKKIKGMHGDGINIPSHLFKDIKNISSKSKSEKYIKNSNIFGTKTIIVFIIYSLLITSFARPQISEEPFLVRKEAREIMLVMDISVSMLERDFLKNNRKITRLDAVKDVVSKFIAERPNDKFGIIFFASNAYLQVPLTFETNTVINIMKNVDAGMAGNSTAIGDALGLALDNLRKDEKNIDKKIIILLTDGESNDGATTINDAIELAKAEKIKTYTIGVGSKQNVISFFDIDISAGERKEFDEDSLQKIAKNTNGKYFHADAVDTLEKIYNEINKMEPTSNEDQFVQKTKELYHIPLTFALFISAILIIWINKRRFE